MPIHVFAPFQELLDLIRRRGTTRWSEIQEPFLQIVEAFDNEYRTEDRSSHWYKSKASYFNEIVATLVSHACAKPVSSGCQKSTFPFGSLSVDFCCPEDSTPTIVGYVKAIGAPPVLGSRQWPSGVDENLHSRLCEVAFRSVDLKASCSGGQSARSFQEWIDSTSPMSFSFWAIRVNLEADAKRVQAALLRLRAWCNGVAALVYHPVAPDLPTAYKAKRLARLDMDRVIQRSARCMT